MQIDIEKLALKALIVRWRKGASPQAMLQIKAPPVSVDIKAVGATLG